MFIDTHCHISTDYYENIDGLIYVIDASDEERMEECNELFQQLLKEEKLKTLLTKCIPLIL